MYYNILRYFIAYFNANSQFFYRDFAKRSGVAPEKKKILPRNFLSAFMSCS